MPSFFENFPNKDFVMMFGDIITRQDGTIMNGLLDNATEDGQISRLEVRYRTPVLTMLSEDSDNISKGELLEVQNKKYTVDRVLKDGTGMSEVVLVEYQKDPVSGDWV